MHSLTKIGFTLLVGIVTVSLAVAETDSNTLESLKLEFQIHRQEIEAPRGKLNENYGGALKTLREKVRKQGALNQVVLVDKELEGFSEGNHQSADGFSDLSRLQTIYLAEIEKIEKQESEDMKALLTSYKRRLADLVKKLTISDQVSEALAAKDEEAKATRLLNELENSTDSSESSSMKPSSANPSATRKLRIPTDAVEFEGHSYKLFDIPPRNWREVKEKCEEMDGHLVIINSEEEYRFITQLAENKHVWVGALIEATEEQPSSSWKWVDGTDATEMICSYGVKNIPRKANEYVRFLKGKFAGALDVNSLFVNGYICEWEGVR